MFFGLGEYVHPDISQFAYNIEMADEPVSTSDSNGVTPQQPTTTESGNGDTESPPLEQAPTLATVPAERTSLVAESQRLQREMQRAERVWHFAGISVLQRNGKFYSHNSAQLITFNLYNSVADGMLENGRAFEQRFFYIHWRHCKFVSLRWLNFRLK